MTAKSFKEIKIHLPLETNLKTPLFLDLSSGDIVEIVFNNKTDFIKIIKITNVFSAIPKASREILTNDLQNKKLKPEPIQVQKLFSGKSLEETKQNNRVIFYETPFNKIKSHLFSKKVLFFGGALAASYILSKFLHS